MNAQQKAVALWKFLESQGMKPSVRKVAAMMRLAGVPIDDHAARVFLAEFAARAPHPKATRQKNTAHPPHGHRTPDAQSPHTHRDDAALYARGEVSLVSDTLPLFQSGEPTPTKIPKPKKPAAEWTVPLIATVTDMNESALASLTPSQVYTVARFHALTFAGCSREERTNKARATQVAVGLAKFIEWLVRRHFADFTVAEYVAAARVIHARREGQPWFDPFLLTPLIQAETGADSYAIAASGAPGNPRTHGRP